MSTLLKVGFYLQNHQSIKAWHRDEIHFPSIQNLTLDGANYFVHFFANLEETLCQTINHIKLNDFN